MIKDRDEKKPSAPGFKRKPAVMVDLAEHQRRRAHADGMYDALFKGAAPPKWTPTPDEQARIDALNIPARYAAWEASRKAGPGA